LRLRPDLKPVLLRGNVETRLNKAESGAVGATLLALAGLKRLGLAHRARAVLDIDKFLPAPGQGAIAITARGRDTRMLETLNAISDR
jgi:hydroxymethylbilane synthase